MSTQTQLNKAMRRLEWGMLLTLSVLRGDSFFFNDIAVKELPTSAIFGDSDNDFLEGSNYMARRIPGAVNRAYGEFLATL